ncbi:MAG: hypothetical protein FWE09_03550 [Treponema sp.]|nr:hypothetical protein [Treponema sp.]
MNAKDGIARPGPKVLSALALCVALFLFCVPAHASGGADDRPETEQRNEILWERIRALGVEPIGDWMGIAEAMADRMEGMAETMDAQRERIQRQQSQIWRLRTVIVVVALVALGAAILIKKMFVLSVKKRPPKARGKE